MHPLEHPPKPLNLRLQPLHQGAVTAPGQGRARRDSQAMHAGRSEMERGLAGPTAAARCAWGCCAVLCNWPKPASPVVCPGGAACAKGDAELNVVRLKPELLQPHTQTGAASQKCSARHGVTNGVAPQLLATSAHQQVWWQQAGSCQPCFALPHAHAPIHLEEEEVVAV